MRARAAPAVPAKLTGRPAPCTRRRSSRLPHARRSCRLRVANDSRAAMTKPRPASLPLADIRVLEFTQNIMGPSAGLVLADLGADVVKIEPAPAGDSPRRLSGFAAGFFGYFNRNKRSLAVDLKHPAGRALVHKLAAQTDVVIENYAPGTMDRLGCGHAALSALNPRLVYCAL